jgi:hypothetical protein
MKGVSVLALALFVMAGCAPQAMRGGEGTENPDLDRPALSVQLDRDDITYLVSDYLSRLEASPFWQQGVKGSARPPVVAIWPIQNATSQHLDDQMLTLLSSIETSLVNTQSVQVVDRSRQEHLAEEIGIQHDTAFDPASAQKLGRQLGAKYFFTGQGHVGRRAAEQHAPRAVFALPPGDRDRDRADPLPERGHAQQSREELSRGRSWRDARTGRSTRLPRCWCAR